MSVEDSYHWVKFLSSDSDSGESSSSSSNSSSEENKDEEEELTNAFTSILGDKFQFVNPNRGSGRKSKKQQPGPRKSILFSNAKHADELSLSENKVSYTRIQPSFEHIKLEKLNIPRVH